MRIGIVPGLNASDGGIYQYSSTMLQALDNRQMRRDSFVLFANNMRHPALIGLRNNGWVVKPLVPITLRRRFVCLAERVVGPRPREAMFRLAGRLFHRNTSAPSDLDSVCFNLMLYAISSSLSFETGIPYVMAVHDLQHRLQPQFPEVSANGEWESREYLFRNGIRNATLLLAESETGKEDILNFYGHYRVTPDRIKVLPLLPSSMLAEEVSPEEQHRVRAAYELPERYMFYPAQFWPHKNHLRIVEALGSLKKERGLEIPILFCGFHSGEVREQVFAEVMSRAAKLGIDKQIKYLGYVPDQDMAALYQGARALIMPTFFGATNIPPLEAWSLGCPVLTSDIRGIRQQAGEAAILVDPESIKAIAHGICRLWTDDELCRELIQKGKDRTNAFTLQDFRVRLAEIIEEAKSRVTGKPAINGSVQQVE